jgi:gluconolactonase
MEIRIEKLSPKADRLLPNAELTRLCGGYLFSEGPVWDDRQECLYFTDFQRNEIWRWSERDGARLYREGSNRAIGLSMDASGRIVSAESSKRRIAYADGKASEQIVGAYRGKPLNSPNDVVVARSGIVFFTDPYSEMMGGPKDLGFNGVFSILPGGELQLIDDSYDRPNGISLSPDESVLYVNDTKRQSIYSYALGPGGAAVPKGLFAAVDPSRGDGAVDGMKGDLEGNVYVTGPAGVWVFDPEGKALAILHLPEKAGNLCFGGADAMTLFLTATTSVYSLRVGARGIVPFRK